MGAKAMRTQGHLIRKEKGEVSSRRIMKAARKVFAEHGLGRSRIDHIAAESALNRAMIYYFFESKKNLYKEVIKEVLNEVAKLVDQELSSYGQSPEKLLLFPGKYLQLYFERPESARIILREIVSGGEILRELRAENPEFFSPFQRVVDKLKAPEISEIVSTGEPEMLVLLLIVLGYVAPSALSFVDLLVRPEAAGRFSSPEVWKAFVTELVIRYLRPQIGIEGAKEERT